MFITANIDRKIHTCVIKNVPQSHSAQLLLSIAATPVCKSCGLTHSTFAA